jgi:general stress protein 26
MAVTRKQREHLRDLMKKIDIAMFTTIGQRGFPVSRPLSTQKTELDGDVLWFFVRGNSPKVAEIARNPRVNVAYASQELNAYLSVAGRADLVRNRMKIRDLWHDGLEAWFRKLAGIVTAAITGRDTAMGENRMVRVRKVPAKRAARRPAGRKGATKRSARGRAQARKRASRAR